MTVLLIPDKFKGSLTAIEVIAALTKGIKRADNKIDILQVIASDGGDGFLDAIRHTMDVEEISCSTVDPLGRKIRADYVFNKYKDEAFLELAKASGMELLKEGERNPMITSTLGTGLQIRDAIERGAKKIYIGLGGSATNDGGTGIAQALGYKFLDVAQNILVPSGESLQKIHTIDASGVHKDLKHVAIFAVNDVDNTLYGSKGAAFVYAKQKGASSKDIELLNDGLKCLDRVVVQQIGKNNAQVPGSGAAGGAAYGIKTFLGGTFVSGINFMLQHADMDSVLKNEKIDLIITGEGKIDAQTFSGKLIHGVLELGNTHSIPVLAICGTLELDKGICLENGLHEVLEIRDPSKPLTFNMQNAGTLIEKSIFQFMSSP